MKEYKIGDRVKMVGSSMVGSGIIIQDGISSHDMGMPFDAGVSHYGFTDEKTGIYIVAHPRNLKKITN